MLIRTLSSHWAIGLVPLVVHGPGVLFGLTGLLLRAESVYWLMFPTCTYRYADKALG